MADQKISPDESAEVPAPPSVQGRPLGRPRAADRVRAALEVFWVSLGVAFVTDLALGAWLGPVRGIEEIGAARFAVVLLLQNLLSLLLIAWFLRLEGRGFVHLGFGRGSVAREAALGLTLFPPVLVLAWLLQLGLARIAPVLRTVEVNPLLEMIQGPTDLVLFLAVSVLAGGVGEETIRAFVLRRFESHLGGIGAGLLIWSAVFGLMHLVQGADKAIVVGLLGLALGLVYAWRRNPVAAIALHAAFDVSQTLMVFLGRSAA